MIHIVTNMTIATQRFGKHVPEVTLSTVEGRLLLDNGLLTHVFGATDKHVSVTKDRRCNRRTVRGCVLPSVRPEL
jgi:hypothetical protein